MQNLDSPRLKKALPRYLDLEESMDLLDSVEGKNSSRDYCGQRQYKNAARRRPVKKRRKIFLYSNQDS